MFPKLVFSLTVYCVSSSYVCCAQKRRLRGVIRSSLGDKVLQKIFRHKREEVEEAGGSSYVISTLWQMLL